jgi:hypothetical protein
MFYHVFAAIPEWAPPGEDHILYSDGILREVSYEGNSVKYIAVSGGKEYLRLSFKPSVINRDGELIPPNGDPIRDSWQIRSLGKGDYALTISHSKGGKLIVSK